MRTTDNLVAVGAGGVAGASVRWLVGELVEVDGFAWHTLLVNVVGCVLLGALSARSFSSRVERALGVGFCGGLTTLSTFSIEIVELIDEGDAVIAGAYVLTSVVLGYVGFIAARRALTPTEAGS